MISARDIEAILNNEPKESWEYITDMMWNTFSKPIDIKNVENEIIKRDKNTSNLELLLSGASWNLWNYYENSVYRTSQALIDFWNDNDNDNGKAILILDGLSLRETPFIIDGLKKRNYKIEESMATGSELPADTNAFARSLGLSGRSSIENNGVGQSCKLSGAKTDTVNLPWKDCTNLIGSEKNWLFWHQWPDSQLHEFDRPGYGLAKFTREIHKSLESDDFWYLIERLSTGRTVVITGDHGYSAPELFVDVTDETQKEYLKSTYKSARFKKAQEDIQYWLPPIEKKLVSSHGEYFYVLGRRKWKSSGGYPILTHGGLSLLELEVPFIQFRREGK